ncbi:hypothetical protein [Olsenella sp. Marseille-P4559]|uniref:hypothetical protein n=1 Tax=Olsenella sp. Marseille-P4559 TaxID=2364795 RepID=UPI0010305B33|nr:hypothetical protein [Olsenella sp. Marseille-P4559]
MGHKFPSFSRYHLSTFCPMTGEECRSDECAWAIPFEERGVPAGSDMLEDHKALTCAVAMIASRADCPLIEWEEEW